MTKLYLPSEKEVFELRLICNLIYLDLYYGLPDIFEDNAYSECCEATMYIDYDRCPKCYELCDKIYE